MKLKFLKNNKYGFTLAEILIVLIIISSLFILGMKFYSLTLNIFSRLENEYYVYNEHTDLLKTIQLLVDNNNINYDNYTGTLKDNNGFTNILYLSGNDGKISIYSTGTCELVSGNIVNKDMFCWVEMNRNNQIIKLTNKNKVYIPTMYFRINPTDSYQKMRETREFEEIYNESFSFFLEIYSKKFDNRSWINNVKYNFQTFFNFKKY